MRPAGRAGAFQPRRPAVDLKAEALSVRFGLDRRRVLVEQHGPAAPLPAARRPRFRLRERRRDGGEQAAMPGGGAAGVVAFRELLVDEGRAEAAFGETRAVGNRGEEVDIVPDAADGEAAERAREPRTRLLARRAVRRQLGDHRVVEHGDLGALDHARVDAHAAFLRRRAEGLQPPDGGCEIALRPLCIDPRLDGPAVEADILLAEGERLARRHAQHLLHEVEAGHHLGHRMFDLEAGVHL